MTDETNGSGILDERAKSSTDSVLADMYNRHSYKIIFCAPGRAIDCIREIMQLLNLSH